ncbi:MAG: DoxX family membrane protein, partial [Terriglobales bacterium]
MNAFDKRLNIAWWALRIGLAAEQIAAGTDKFFNKIADWSMYLSPLATKVVPVEPAHFMRAIGIVEIALGILLLTRWTKIAAYLLMLWLVGIVINLLTTGMFYDLAVRDAEVAVAAFSLAQLSAARFAAAPSGAASTA